MSKAVIHEIEFTPGRKVKLETGRLAKQAGGSVVARLGDTMVLAAATVTDSAKEGQSFFPLTVDYREKFSSAGKIPGGFIKREGRPSDKEVLTSRLIDRAIRPLFPDGFFNEVQIICYVLSADGENDADVVAAVAASAALSLTGAPFQGPIAEVRVGRVGGRFIVNPTIPELEESDFNMVVAGRKDAIVMVEGEMDEVGEDDVLEALEIAHDAIRELCKGQETLIQQAGGVTPMEYTVVATPDALIEKVHGMISDRVNAHIRQPYAKETFYGGIRDIKQEVLDALLGPDDPEAGLERADATEEGYTSSDIKGAVAAVEKELMREMILSESKRIDGRSLTEVRDIWCEVGYLPRVHGSSIFTRGETQVLASVTLGTKKDVQAVDQIFDTTDRRFYLHYNFPPFCTGEVKFLRGASRREIGHGVLAERALSGVLPSEDEFPYTVRINADVLESNGSSSMASVCSGTLAMMDAGIPIQKPVAGIAMGLISDGKRTAILSDILGTEDHLGDMDFKLTGTQAGITACQMDIKIEGLSRDVMKQALLQAREGREHILAKMLETLPESREDLSPFAPRLTQFTIETDYIGAVIGPGGKIIQGLQRDTNTIIEIEERDGLGYVTVAATNAEDAEAAINIIKSIASTPEAGQDYEGTVRNIQSFGAIVEIAPGKEGLLHISELDYGYVDNVEDYLAVGDKVKVKLVEVRDDGKLRLSRKPFLEKPEGYEERERERQPRGRGSNGERRGGGGRHNRGGGGRQGRGGGNRRGGGGDRRGNDDRN
ncbi:MAG: polyribonucleotide nucleotidyltransferase [Rhodothermales bacterium]|nr:polyribonucleotide nucleotidyltransferase [Rhodothermales bacterium]